MRRYLLCAALLCAALAGCGRNGSSAGPTPTPLPPNLPGVYAGSVACSNCNATRMTGNSKPSPNATIISRMNVR